MRRRGTAIQTPPDRAMRGRPAATAFRVWARVVLALLLAAAPRGAGAETPALLPAPGAACARCAALVVLPGGPSGPGGAVADALDARGFAVERLVAPEPYRLIAGVGRLLSGAGPDARRVLVLAGRVEERDGGHFLAAGPPPPRAAEAAPGLALDGLADRLRGMDARLLVVADLELPGEARPALGPPRGEGPLLVLRRPGRELAGALAALLERPRALVPAEIADALDAEAETGSPAAEVVAPAPVRQGGGLGALIVPGAERPALTPLADLTLAPPRPPRPAEGAAERCARLAADPEAGPGGVPLDRIDAVAATQACRRALVADPRDAASAHRYGRARQAAGQAAEALPFHRHAAALGHAPAGLALGRLTLDAALREQDRLAPAEFDRRVREGLAEIARAAEAGLPAAALLWRDLGRVALFAGRFGVGQGARLEGMLRRAAPASPEAALALAGLLAAKPRRTEAENAEALDLYRRAMRAGLDGARDGLARLEAEIAETSARAVVAECDRRLAFDVMAVETTVTLPADLSGSAVREAREERMRAALDRLDLAAAVRACAAAMAEPDLPPGLVARQAALALWIKRAQLDASLPDPGSWVSLARRAADAGDPVGAFLYADARRQAAIVRLRAGRGDEAAELAGDAMRHYAAAARGGVAQAAYVLAVMHLHPAYRALPVEKAPQAGLDLLESIQAEAPRARSLLVDIYGGADGFEHLGALRDPGRARVLAVSQ